MRKSEWHCKIERARKACIPQVGDLAWWPEPLTPYSHPDGGRDGEHAEPQEPAMPTPSRHPDDATVWQQGRVVEVAHHERTVDPDDWIAVLEPVDHPGMTVAVAVAFLCDTPPEPIRGAE